MSGWWLGAAELDRDAARSLRNQGSAPPSTLLLGNWSKYQYELPGPATKKSTSCPLLQTSPGQPDPAVPHSAIQHHLRSASLPRYYNHAQLRPARFPISISTYNANPSAKCSVDGILPRKMAATRALETGLQRMSITDENDPREAGHIYQKSKVSSNSHTARRDPDFDEPLIA